MDTRGCTAGPIFFYVAGSKPTLMLAQRPHLKLTLPMTAHPGCMNKGQCVAGGAEPGLAQYGTLWLPGFAGGVRMKPWTSA